MKNEKKVKIDQYGVDEIKRGAINYWKTGKLDRDEEANLKATIMATFDWLKKNGHIAGDLIDVDFSPTIRVTKKRY